MTTATAPPPTTGPALMTAEDFVWAHGGDTVELINGVVVEVPMPKPLHGFVCANATLLIGGFVKQHDFGVVCSNDSFVIVRRKPDTVRGANVAYWPTSKLPGGVLGEGLIEAPPDLCVEVVSPTNRWSEVFIKVGEYLGAGVTVVLVLDPESATASVFRAHNGSGQRILQRDEDLTLPDILPGFSVPVRRFFT